MIGSALMEKGRITMAEYIDKAKALYEMWQNLYKLEDEEERYGLNAFERHDIELGFKAGLKAVVNMPAIDIVGCENCKYYNKFIRLCDIGHSACAPNWFCADMRRRD